MATQHGLDLIELDSISAKLDLVIVTTEKLNRTARQEPCQVTCPVKSFNCSRGRQTCDELRIIQLRAIQIAARDPITADKQLAGLANRNRWAPDRAVLYRPQTCSNM